MTHEYRYENRGVPLEEYEVTRSDRHQQRVGEQIAVAVAKMGEAMSAEEAVDPVLRERRAA